MYTSLQIELVTYIIFVIKLTIAIIWGTNSLIYEFKTNSIKIEIIWLTDFTVTNIFWRYWTSLSFKRLAEWLSVRKFSWQWAHWAVVSFSTIAMSIVNQYICVITLWTYISIVSLCKFTILYHLLTDTVLKKMAWVTLWAFSCLTVVSFTVFDRCETATCSSVV